MWVFLLKNLYLGEESQPSLLLLLIQMAPFHCVLIVLSIVGKEQIYVPLSLWTV